MPVYHSIKTIFIHIPRTGGTSIKRWLHRDNEGPGVGEAFPHLFADEYLKYKFCTEDEFNSYQKITVVRNPWDRCSSDWCKWGKPHPFPEFVDLFVGAGRRAENYTLPKTEEPFSPFNTDRHGTRQTRYLSLGEIEVVDFDKINERFVGLERTNAWSGSDPFDAETEKKIADAYGEEIAMFGFKR